MSRARGRDKRQAPDPQVAEVVALLEGRYKADHPGAEVDVYRRNAVSIRVRVVNPDFRGTSRAERDDDVQRYLDQLPEATQSDITLLLLLTPEETTTSFANTEFEHPSPSSV